MQKFLTLTAPFLKLALLILGLAAIGILSFSILTVGAIAGCIIFAIAYFRKLFASNKTTFKENVYSQSDKLGNVYEHNEQGNYRK